MNREEKGDFKFKVLKFFERHGEEITLDAINLEGQKLSRATLYRWKREYRTLQKQSRSKLELRPKSTKPLSYRGYSYNPLLAHFITAFRKKRFGVGKFKLEQIIKRGCSDLEYALELERDYGFNLFGLEPISASTINRIISKLKEARQIPRNAKEYNRYKEVYLDGSTGDLKIRKPIDRSKLQGVSKLRRKDYQPEMVGDLIQLDAITIQLGNKKKYFVSGIDLTSRIAYNRLYDRLDSKATSNFLLEFEKELALVTGKVVVIKHLQNDNGQENHKHFIATLQEKEIIQFWNYPRSPKMNAFVEKFNHTVQCECIEWHQYLLKQGRKEEFNEKLKEWNDWYNRSRPHTSLQYMSPLEYYRKQLEGSRLESQM